LSDSQSSNDIPKESPRAILFQFVVFPLGIVCVAVAIFLLFGRLAGEEHSIPDYLNEIRSGSKHERWQAAYQLSRSIKRGETKRYPNLEQQVESIYRGAKHDDPLVRRYLSIVLGELGDRRATPLLIEATGDKDLETRIYAAIGLGELRDPAGVPRLIVMLKEDDSGVRKAASYALGELHDARAVEPLAALLADETADVRWNAAIALAQFGDRRAVPVLLEMLDRTRLDRVRKMTEEQKEDAMIMALAVYPKVVGAAEAAPELQRIAANDPSLRVRDAAKQAIRQ